MNWSELLLNRKNGKVSARQLLFLAWGITLIGMWIAFSIVAGSIVDMPAGIQMISGLILGSHVASTWVDNRSPIPPAPVLTPTPTPPTTNTVVIP